MSAISGDLFAARHRARRARLLVAELERLVPEPYRLAVAERLSEVQWTGLAARAGITTPSETTRAMVIGLLSVPDLKGLTCP